MPTLSKYLLGKSRFSAIPDPWQACPEIDPRFNRGRNWRPTRSIFITDHMYWLSLESPRPKLGADLLVTFYTGYALFQNGIIYTLNKVQSKMAGTNQKTKIIAVLDDLFFSSKIKEAVQSLDLHLEFIKNTNGLIPKLKSEKPSLIIFDLNSKACNPLESIKEIKSLPDLNNIPILGYLSHIQTDLKDEAAKAGCDLVLPRSKFSKDLKEIITRYSIQR